MVRRAIALGVLALTLTACIGAVYTPPPPPPEASAVGYLNELVELVSSGDVASICTLGASTCPKSLRDSDPATVPVRRPQLVGTDVIQPRQRADGTWETGGLVLKLCGVNGQGADYYSELLVFQDGNRLIATDPLYWTGTRVAENPDTEVAGESPCP